MLWILELPVMFLGVYHSKSSAFAIVFYLLFCLYFGRKAKNKLHFPQFPLLAVTVSVCLGAAFYRAWMPYAHTLPVIPGISRPLTVTVGAVALAVLSISGVDIALSCLLGELGGQSEKVHRLVQHTAEVVCQYRWSVILPVFLTMLVCNFIFLRDGFGSPDCTLEGIAIYSGAWWATSLGRWAIRFINLALGNTVLHGLCFVVSAAALSLVVVMVVRLFRLRRTCSIVLSAVALSSALTVSFQFLYVYLVIPFAAAILFSTLSAWLILTGTPSKKRILAAAACLAFSMGCYQAYLSFCCTLILMSLLLRLLEGEDWHTVLKSAGYALGMGVCAGVLYIVCMKANSILYSAPLSSYGGLNSIGIKSILLFLPASIMKCYLWFMLAFSEYMAPFGVSAAFLVLALLLEAWRLFRRKVSRQNFAMACLGGLLLPIAMNMVSLLAPGYEFVSPLMSHAVYLLIVLLLALLERDEGKKSASLWTAAWPVIALFCIVCVMEDNAIHYSTSYTAKYDISIMEDVRNQVCRMEEYNEETRVFLVGFPASDETLMQNPLFDRTPIYFRTVMSWTQQDGAASGWDKFSQNYLGWHTGRFTPEEQEEIMKLPMLSDMPDYPKSGSIQAIDGNVILVKFRDEQNKPYFWVRAIETILTKLNLI